ncbi:MAG: GreA/GreB family elongation factor [Bacillota bacterium]
MSVRVLGLDPGRSTGWCLCQGYEILAYGSERDALKILERVDQVDVVVVEDALDMDQVEPLRRVLDVPWVGVTPEQLQRRLFSRVLGRKQVNGPLARQEVVRRAFGRTPGDVHALDAACLALWWLIGSELATGAPDLGNLKVWDQFTIADEFGEESYQVVPPNTADPANGMVSWASPLVEAVKHARPGDRVVVKAPAGDWECRLVRIERTE